MAATPAAPLAVPAAPGRRRTARNVAASASAAIAGKVTTFIWTVIAARTLSRADFGTFNLVLAVALVAGSIAEWGFDPALVQRASRDVRDGSRYFTEAVTWEAIVAVPVFAACGFAVALTHSGAGTTAAVGLVMASVFLDAFGDTARTAATAVHRQGATSAALVLQRTLSAVIAAPLLLAGGGVAGLALGLFVGSFVGLLAHLYVLGRLGVVVRPRVVSRRGMRMFVQGTLAIGLSTLVLAALFRVDVVLLHALKGPVAVGNYSAAYKLFDTALFVVFSVNGALFPLMSAHRDEPRFVARMVESGLAVSAVFYLPFAAACLVDGREVLVLLFGSSFGDVSVGALRALAPAPLVFGFAYLVSSALVAVNRSRALLVAAIVAVVLNVGLNLLLIPSLSGTGAALVTTISYLAESVILTATLERAIGARVHLARALAPAAVASLAFAGMLLVLHLPVLAELGLAIAVGAAAWVATVSRTDPSQFDVVRQMIPGRHVRSSAADDAVGTPIPSDVRRRPVAHRTTVLMYHAVDNRSQMQDPHNLFVRPEAFAAQLNLLADRGYIPLTLDEYLNGLDHKRWPARSYLVTFDDGYVSTLRVAAPLLAARDIPAILFVPGGRIGMTSDWMPAMPREPLLDADGLRAVTAFGIEVGVHGFDHRDMVALDAATLHEHTVVAKDLLADALGVTPRAFAYPRGRHDAAAVDAVRSAGYSVGFATVGRGGRFAEPRIAIDSTDTLRTFRLKTVAWWPWAMRAGRASPAMRRAVHALLGYEPRPTVASSPDGAVTAAIDDAPPSPRVR